MEIINTKFKGLFLIKKKTFKDSRGYFREIYIQKKIKKNFCFSILSKSKKNVLRGLHFQKINPQAKYLSVVKGKIFDVALDLRKKSKTFGKYFSIVLSDKDNISLFIPEGFAHGFYTMKEDTIIYYKCSQYRHKHSETGIIWNDPSIKIKWPTKKTIISEKDKKNISFKEFKKINKFF